MSPGPARVPANLAHFAINADDVGRAMRFYERVFGWRFTAWGPPGFFQIRTGSEPEPGVQGALQKRREWVEGERNIGFECTIAVGDVDEVAAEIVAGGGSIVLPRVHLPGVGHLIFFRDTEGNIAGAMQYDSSEPEQD